MDILTAARSFRRDFTRFDCSQVSLLVATRNTVGVVLPLTRGAASGNLLAGLTIAIGAINVAFDECPFHYFVPPTIVRHCKEIISALWSSTRHTFRPGSQRIGLVKDAHVAAHASRS